MFGCNKNFLFAVSILIGTIVGAGIFGIPYVISRSGLVPGLFYLFVLGGVLLLIHLLYGEVILRTEGRHHLPSLALKYLGKRGSILIAISTFVGMVVVLLAYTILGGEFLKIVFSSLIDLPSFYFSLIFLVFLSYFVFRGIKLIAPTELVTNIIFFSIILMVFLFALPKVNLENFCLLNLPQDISPYGVILFSLIGLPAVPILGVVLEKEERKSFKKVLIISFSVVIIFYLLFSLTIIGVSGSNTSPEALQGLTPFLGPRIILFGALAAVVTLADSFLAIALYFKNTLVYDYKISRKFAFIFTCGLPLALFLLGFRSFIGTIGFAGIIIGTIEGLAVILIFRKAKVLGDRQPEYSLKVPSVLLYFLMMILILGVASQIL